MPEQGGFPSHVRPWLCPQVQAGGTLEPGWPQSHHELYSKCVLGLVPFLKTGKGGHSTLWAGASQGLGSEHPASADSSLLECLGHRSPREPLLAEDLPALVRNECLHAQWSRGTATSAFCLLRMTQRLMWAQAWLGHPGARTVHPGSGATTRLCQHLWDEPGDPPRRVTAACCPPSERRRPLGFALRPLFQDRSDLGTGRAR